MAITFAPTTLDIEYTSMPGIWVIPPARVKTELDKIYEITQTAQRAEAA
jgi:hypothetical protein